MNKIKKTIAITIEESNYLEALKRGIIKDRQLSSILNDFLTTLFTSPDSLDLSNLKMERDSLFEEKQKIEHSLFDVSRDLSVINAKIEELSIIEKKNDKEQRNDIKKMNESLINSGILKNIIQ